MLHKFLQSFDILFDGSHTFKVLNPNAFFHQKLVKWISVFNYVVECKVYELGLGFNNGLIVTDRFGRQRKPKESVHGLHQGIISRIA